MTEPTDGPWTFVQMAAGIEVHGRSGELIHKEDWCDIPAELDDDRKEALWQETVANARLIAKARHLPALIEALWAVWDWAQEHDASGEPWTTVANALGSIDGGQYLPASKERHLPELIRVLEQLDARLDFNTSFDRGEWGIENPAVINQAFREAAAALALVQDTETD